MRAVKSIGMPTCFIVSLVWGPMLPASGRFASWPSLSAPAWSTKDCTADELVLRRGRLETAISNIDSAYSADDADRKLSDLVENVAAATALGE